MHPEILDENTQSVLDAIGASALANTYYLAGGTALALQYGHRRSHDLDFFTDRDFDRAMLRTTLSRIGDLSIDLEEDGTLSGTLASVKVSFFRYPYSLLFPTRPYHNIMLADPRDIGAMKLDAVASRGSKKDFVDMYVLLAEYSLAELVSVFEKRFADVHYNITHILKSLAYFEDAETEPDPDFLAEISWETVKESVAAAASTLLDAQLDRNSDTE